METEKSKMLCGALYNPDDKQLSIERLNARLLIKAINDSDANQYEMRMHLLRELLPNAGLNLRLEPPFFCDYGYNIKTGADVYFNFNCTVLDCARVSIGDRVLFGPNVQIYTATHPLSYQIRASGLEFAKPITIGDDVWIGGCVVICPGVSIGSRSVIGAGSVVTKDVPADVLAGGNPCTVIRQLTQEI